jgi:hypothetical protein
LIVIMVTWEGQEQKSWVAKPHVDQSRSHALTIWLIVTRGCGMQPTAGKLGGQEFGKRSRGNPALSIGELSLTLDRCPWLGFGSFGLGRCGFEKVEVCR